MKENTAVATLCDTPIPADAAISSDDKFWRVFQYGSDAISIADLASRRYLEVNHEFVRMSGYPRDQVIGRTAQELGFWRDSPESEAFSNELLRTGAVRNHETVVTAAAGRRLNLLISAVLIEVEGRRCTLAISRDITDLKRAQDELRSADRRLRDVLANAPVAMTVINNDGIITLSEGAGLEAMNYAPNQLVGHSLDELGPPGSAIARHAREALAGEQQVAIEEFNGRIFEVWYSPVRDSRKRITGAMSVATDITARVAIQDELKRKEEFYRSLIETLPDTVMTVDQSGTIRFVGGAGPRNFGYSADQVVGHSALNFIHRENQADQKRLMGAAFENPGTVIGSEARALVPNGIWVPVELMGRVAPGPDGQPILIVTMRNIAERKQAQEELRRREEYYRTLIEASSDLIVVIDIRGVVIFAGGQGLRDIAESSVEVIGLPASDFEHPDDVAEQIKTVAWSFDNPGRIVRTEVRLRGVGGDWIPFEFAGRVIAGLDGMPRLVTTGRNIAERKRIESELAAARDAALAASRAKSDFVSSMSHEIRTPMNAILGMADLLWETDLSSDQRRSLGTIISNGNSLLELINSVLDFAKVESGKMSLELTSFDLRDLVERVRELFEVRAREKNLELSAKIAAGIPAVVCGDPMRLRQILINLVANAIKFTERGTVAIEAAQAMASANRGAALVQFTVADTGIGLTPGQLEMIFSPFTQADSSTTRKYGGSGLGLAIAARLAALMDGKIWAESSPGIGSRFHFTARLEPACADFSEAATQSSSSPARIVDRPLRILLADDSPDNRMLIAAYLKKTPYRLETAENGQIAYQKYVAAGADLILMDIQMPVLDGYGAIKMIRSHELETAQARTPIIALSASALEDSVSRSIGAGCDLHVSKPVKRATLLEAIAAAVEPSSTRT